VKFLVVFLSKVVLALSLMPCCALKKGETHVEEIVHKKDNPCDKDADDHCNDCSPFYACGACVGFATVINPILAFDLHIKLGHHTTPYVQNEVLFIGSSIWQPPKLS
jgi:hypothetical protein